MTDCTSRPPMAVGPILIELFKLRERLLAEGFSEPDIAASMRLAPVWFPSFAEPQEAA